MIVVTVSRMRSCPYRFLFSRAPDNQKNAHRVWDSLAEAYRKSGNLKKAEEYYQKALTRDANDQNAKDMLTKLQESKEK